MKIIRVRFIPHRGKLYVYHLHLDSKQNQSDDTPFMTHLKLTLRHIAEPYIKDLVEKPNQIIQHVLPVVPHKAVAEVSKIRRL